ncbi:HAMP domain-containing protein [Aureimonas fodinaquatilis]|uniref:HAMP domain-containing protein n=1 Tax=Aureimonas fodinaquatilis TaxID=2565783 RepID=A0A5B0DP40_9HYPH|nr:histidine kinase [Aureimonas fodinaquatilis]KAA0968607.1 HAMP domain-containing protein [Aureimonas fodinaquatilis]
MQGGSPDVSLQARLIVAILGALAAMLLLGGLASSLHVRERIENEMRSAHIVAEHRIARQIAELPATMDHEGKFRALLRTFDSDRHARLSLLGRDGKPIARSHLQLPRQPAPEWFSALFAPRAIVSVVPLTTGGSVSALELVLDPASHTRDVWTDLGLGLTIISLFVCLSLLLVYVIARTSLKPLKALRIAMGRIGDGQYDVRVDGKGPPEVQALAASCNDMAVRLQAMTNENRRLGELVYRLQEEERAELARDLHDEIGPFLFSIDVDATALQASAPEPLQSKAASIRAAADHARKAVRRILGNLRPGLLPGLGLQETLTHMISSFEAQHPATRFGLTMQIGSLDPETEALLLRVLREAVLNALRHGTPTRIDVSLMRQGNEIEFEVKDNGGGSAQFQHGFGISGMRERLEAAGGRLAIEPVLMPAGLRVAGCVPLHDQTGGNTAYRKEAA